MTFRFEMCTILPKFPYCRAHLQVIKTRKYEKHIMSQACRKVNNDIKHGQMLYKVADQSVRDKERFNNSFWG